MATEGPGCGHADHPPMCACDVVIRTVVPIRHTPYEWYNGVLTRAGIDLAHDPRGWDFVADLLRAEEAKVRRAGLHLDGTHYGDGRKLLRAHLTDGGWTSELYEDDRACAVAMGPDYRWNDVLSIWTTHNTRGRVRINVWDRFDWENFEQCVIEREPVTRALARELGISRYTIERMYDMHGLPGYDRRSPGDVAVGA